MGFSKRLTILWQYIKASRDVKIVAWTKNFKQGDHSFNLIMKPEQAECLLDFLEAEFAEGIGKDPDCVGIEYVENIRSVYVGLKRMVK